MIKLVCFDLDGVLVDSKPIHRNSLNQALLEVDEKYVITDDQREIFEALPTRRKLQMLTEQRGLPESFHKQIFDRKQNLTRSIIFKEIQRSAEKIDIMRELHKRSIKVAVCSNTIRDNLEHFLHKLGIFYFVDYMVSNQDVEHPKPHPEMYLKAMSVLAINKENTLIVEDSDVGMQAANASGAHTLKVENAEAVTVSKIIEAINQLNGMI